MDFEQRLSREEFLKRVGLVSAASLAILAGCEEPQDNGRLLTPTSTAPTPAPQARNYAAEFRQTIREALQPGKQVQIYAGNVTVEPALNRRDGTPFTGAYSGSSYSRGIDYSRWIRSEDIYLPLSWGLNPNREIRALELGESVALGNLVYFSPDHGKAVEVQVISKRNKYDNSIDLNETEDLLRFNGVLFKDLLTSTRRAMIETVTVTKLVEDEKDPYKNPAVFVQRADGREEQILRARINTPFRWFQDPNHP